MEIVGPLQDELRDLLARPGSTDAQRRLLAELGTTSDWVAAKSEYRLGRVQQALARLARSDATWTDAGDGTRSLASSLQATLLIDLGLPDLAAEPLKSAISLCEDERAAGGERNLGAYFDAHIGEIQRCMAINRFSQAISAADAAERGVDWAVAEKDIGQVQANLRRRELELLRGAALVELAADDSEVGDKARVLLEGLVEQEGIPLLNWFTIRTKLIQLDLAQGELEGAEEGLAEVDRRLEPEVLRSFPTQERAWLATLRAQLARRLDRGRGEATLTLRSEFESVCKEWRAVDRPGGVGFLRYRRARALLVELLIDGPEVEALQTLSESQQMGVLWRALREPKPTFAEIRAALCSEGTGCLVFVTSMERSLLIAFDADTIQRFIDLPGYAWIEDRQEELISALRATGRGEADSTGKWKTILGEIPTALAEKLLPEEARKLLEGWKRVRIVGRDQLAHLPCELLPVRDGQPLGTTHAVSDLPSLPVAEALARRRAKAPESSLRVVLLAAPHPDPAVVQDFAILGDRVIEARHVEPLREVLGSRLAKEFLGEAATLGAAEGAWKSGNVLHVFAHGLVDLTRELRPVLVLTPDEKAADGLMTVELARGLKVPDLVFLSACRTADGVDRFGDAGASHLGGALLQAGASSVVVSDEDQQLEDALALAKSFYAHFDPRQGAAEALREAREELRRRSARPSAWGTVYVYGLGD